MPRRRKLSRGRTSAGPWTWSPLPELRTTLPCLTMLHEHTRECLAIYVPGAILLSCPGSGRRPLASAHPLDGWARRPCPACAATATDMTRSTRQGVVQEGRLGGDCSFARDDGCVGLLSMTIDGHNPRQLRCGLTLAFETPPLT